MGYYEAYLQALQHGLPMMTFAQRQQQERFMNQMRVAQLQRAYQQMAQQEQFRNQTLQNQGINQQRLLMDLQERLRHNRVTEGIGQGNLSARREAVERPHFGGTMELQDAQGNPRTVVIDSKSGRLYDPISQQWIPGMTVGGGRPGGGQPGPAGQPGPGGAAVGQGSQGYVDMTALRKPTPLPVSARSQLQGQADNLRSLVMFAKSFKPEYTNALGPQMGQLENVARQYVPLPQSVVSTDMPNFWRQYQLLSQIPERHKSFGGALTKNEQQSWDKADINPGMKPADIRRNLNIRIGLVRLATERSMSGLAPRFNKREIESSAGMDMPQQRQNFFPDDEGMAGLGQELTGVGGVPALDEILK